MKITKRALKKAYGEYRKYLQLADAWHKAKRNSFLELHLETQKNKIHIETVLTYPKELRLALLDISIQKSKLDRYEDGRWVEYHIEDRRGFNCAKALLYANSITSRQYEYPF